MKRFGFAMLIRLEHFATLKFSLVLGLDVILNTEFCALEVFDSRRYNSYNDLDITLIVY